MSGHGIEVIVRGVCVVEGCVLLCHGRGHGKTYLPGGHIEKGESAGTALAREIKEELDLDAHVGPFLGAVENRFEQKGRRVDEINLLFRLEIPGLHPSAAVRSAEAWLDFRWVPLEALETANLRPESMVTVLRDVAGPEARAAGWGSNYPPLG